MGLVPIATKAETKMAFGLCLETVMGFMMTLMLAYSVSNTYVHANFRFLFMLFCLGMYLWLIRPAPNNPKRRLWQGFLLWMKRLMTPSVYLSIVGYAYKEFMGVKQIASDP